MRALALLSALLLVASGCDSDSGGDGAPVTAQILKVVVLDAPLADPAGDGWDGGDPADNGPEIYFRLFDDVVDYQGDPGGDRLNPRDDSDVIPFRSAQPWFEDVSGIDFPLTWDIEPGYVVRDLNDPLYIALFDYDSFTTGGDDDPMAESTVFVLLNNAPRIVTGRTQTLTLGGFDRNGDAIDDFEVRITVQFFD